MENYSIRNLTFTYPEEDAPAIENISLTVSQGEFVVLCGASGCGKTTLLRQLKTVLTPHGERTGEILFEGVPLEKQEPRKQASDIGFVLQSVDSQLVTDKVWHELAFGLEGLGFSTPVIRRRVAEMASFFGIQDLFYRNVSELSGGQKQLINLASVMVMQPSVLILDEPSSQLDPVAASDFIGMLGKINRELGTTIIMTEHRLEEVFPICSRVVVMEKGHIICDGTPEEAGEYLKKSGHPMFLAMPAPMRIYAEVPNELECPVSVRDGADWLADFALANGLRAVPERKERSFDGLVPSVELKDVWFRYEKDGRDILKGVSLKAYPGEFLAVLGGNGTGKTTLLSVAGGVNRAYRGKILIKGRPAGEVKDLYDGVLGMLPQNPQALFVKKTVREDLLEVLKGKGYPKDEQEKRMLMAADSCGILELLDRHPYDLSGGEQQKAALSKVLLLRPWILLLDEPTKGLDAEFKQEFAKIIEGLLKQGVTVIMVSHDIEFCAEHAHRCALFFDGNAVVEEDKDVFFRGNSFYTTSANRMAGKLLPDAVTAGDIIYACGVDSPAGGTGSEASGSEDADSGLDEKLLYAAESGKKKVSSPLPLWRKIAGGIFLVFTAVFFVLIVRRSDLSELLSEMGNTYKTPMTAFYAGFLISISGALLFLSRSSENKIGEEQPDRDKRKLSKRTVIALVVTLVAIPLTIFIGVYYLKDRKYYFISLLVILEALLPFAAAFEGRKPQARELVITSVLCAIAVAGRGAFFMLPNFKPVIALVIISGVAFGGETGFLVGAMTMLVSNIMFGQGPWTPWQMFAMGIIGLIAGVLFRKGFLRRNRVSLCIFGVLAAVVIYGGIMNPATVIMYQPVVTKEMIITACITGFPYDLVQAAGTAVFLWVASKPMLEKLDRVKTKYGLL